MPTSTKTLPYMPLYVRDHVAATRGMTLAERGAYADLLCFNWDHGVLDKDPARLALLLGCTPKEFAAVWPTLRGKFMETEQGLVHMRLEAERAKAAEKHLRAVEKASEASRKRWDAMKPDGRRNAPSMAPRIASSVLGAMPGAILGSCHPDPHPDPDPNTNHPDSGQPPTRMRARPATPSGPPARPGAYATTEDRQQSMDIALHGLPGADDETLMRMVNGATIKDVRTARERADARDGGRDG